MASASSPKSPGKRREAGSAGFVLRQERGARARFPVSGWRWVASHLSFAVLGPILLIGAASIAAGLAYGLSTGDVEVEFGRVLSQALVQLPAVWVLIGVSAALFGLWPRRPRPWAGPSSRRACCWRSSAGPCGSASACSTSRPSPTSP